MVPSSVNCSSVGASTLIESKLGWWAGIGSVNAIQNSVAVGARALLKIIPTLQEIDPDVVYTQTITIPWGASAAALLDKPHYWSICEFGELDHGLSFVNGFADVIEQVKSGASFIRTPSEAVRTTLFPDLGPDRVRTVYRPGQMPIAISPSNEHFHRAGATRLAVFGTLIRRKGADRCCHSNCGAHCTWSGCRAFARWLLQALNIERKSRP